MSKHTPGPWISLQKSLSGENQNGIPQDAYWHEVVYDSDYGGPFREICHIGDHPQAEANANLIAAAPEMYEALKGTIEMLEFMGADPSAKRIQLAKKAIAKAMEVTP